MDIGILLLGGKSQRFGSDKLMENLNGKKVFRHSLDKMLEIFDQVVIVSDLDIFASDNVVTVKSGATRTQSVRNALKWCEGKEGTVTIHDGARPFATKELFLKVMKSAKEFGSGVAAIKNVDALRKFNGNKLKEEVSRDVVKIQTPQSFDLSKLLQAYDKVSGDFNDDSTVFSAFFDCHFVDGEDTNMKITFPKDLNASGFFQNEDSLLFDSLKRSDAEISPSVLVSQNEEQEKETNNEEKLIDEERNEDPNQRNKQTAQRFLDLASPLLKVGCGYDVHSLETNRKFVLGGITIPHTKGMVAHSDGDVLIHAVMDALLSACGLADIGVHFPDSDPLYKNVDSKQLLEKVAVLIRQTGFSPVNISATIMCQNPKLSPYVEGMKDVLSGILKIPTENIGISVTTTETLGIIGEEKGVAVSAVALVKREFVTNFI